MKTPSDSLFLLIKSLSRSEKRYFRINKSSQETFLALYTIINKMDEYDEAKVKRHFSETKTKDNLKVYKHLLFDLILETLVELKTVKFSKHNQSSQLEAVEILLDRGFYKEAKTRLKKIEKLCLKKNYYAQLVEVKLLKACSNYCPIIAECKDIGESFSLYQLHQELTSFLGLSNHLPKQAEFSSTKDFLDAAISEVSRLETDLKFIKLLEWALRFDLTSLQIDSGDYESARINIKNNAQLISAHVFMKRLDNCMLLQQTILAFRTKNFEKIKTNLLPSYKEFIAQTKADEHSDFFLNLYFCISSYVNNDPSQTLRHFNTTYDLAKKNFKIAIPALDIMEVMLHYEVEDTSLSKTFLSRTRRNIMKVNNVSHFLELSIHSLNQIVKEKSSHLVVDDWATNLSAVKPTCQVEAILKNDFIPIWVNNNH